MIVKPHLQSQEEKVQQIDGNIYLREDRKFYFVDETADWIGPYSSVACTRLYMIEYGDWLDTGRVLNCE